MRAAKICVKSWCGVHANVKSGRVELVFVSWDDVRAVEICGKSWCGAHANVKGGRVELVFVSWDDMRAAEACENHSAELTRMSRAVE